MKSSESLSKLAPALAKAQAEFRPVGKSGENKFDKYNYANLEDYVSAVRKILAEHGLCLLSSSEEIIALDDRATKNGGTEHAVRVKLTTRIVHESGEWIETCSCGEGQDRADKSVYKAITGARKYALASALNLATTDDPEQDDDHEPPPPASKRDQIDPAVKAKGDKVIADVFHEIEVAGTDLDALKGVGTAIASIKEKSNGYVRGRIEADVRPVFAKAMAAAIKNYQPIYEPLRR